MHSPGCTADRVSALASGRSGWRSGKCSGIGADQWDADRLQGLGTRYNRPHTLRAGSTFAPAGASAGKGGPPLYTLL